MKHSLNGSVAPAREPPATVEDMQLEVRKVIRLEGDDADDRPHSATALYAELMLLDADAPVPRHLQALYRYVSARYSGGPRSMLIER